VVFQLLRTWALLSCFVTPMLAESLPGAAHPQIVVSVFNDAGVGQATILEGERIAAEIYAQAGLEAAWNNCSTEPGPAAEECLQRLGPGRIFLHIEHQPRTLDPDVYGVAFLGDGGTGAYCDLFYDRIEELHRQSAASAGKILGLVAAHEIGHLLLGTNAHSSVGIMRPQWQSQDFWHPQLGATSFSPQQAQKISARLAQMPSVEESPAEERSHRRSADQW